VQWIAAFSQSSKLAHHQDFSAGVRAVKPFFISDPVKAGNLILPVLIFESGQAHANRPCVRGRDYVRGSARRRHHNSTATRPQEERSGWHEKFSNLDIVSCRIIPAKSWLQQGGLLNPTRPKSDTFGGEVYYARRLIGREIHPHSVAKGGAQTKTGDNPDGRSHLCSPPPNTAPTWGPTPRTVFCFFVSLWEGQGQHEIRAATKSEKKKNREPGPSISFCCDPTAAGSIAAERFPSACYATVEARGRP